MNEEIQRLAHRVEGVRQSLPKSCGSYIHSELTEIRVALEKLAGTKPDAAGLTGITDKNP